MKKWKVSAIVAAVTLIASFEITGVFAYFTDNKEKMNTFTIGNINIELTEPKWDETDEEEHKGVAPGKEITKDPQVTNVGENDAFVFLVVTSPNIRNEYANRVPLFEYDINEGWVDITDNVVEELGSISGGMIGINRTSRRVYAYGTNSELTKLAKGETTSTLFDSVTVTDIIEDKSFENTSYNIMVFAYAIQSDNINSNENGEGKTDPVSVWKVLENQSMGMGGGVILQ